jgi:hypothetical protein
MAVSVIDGLEVVDVDDDRRPSTGVEPATPVKHIVDVRTVGKTGQRIGSSRVLGLEQPSRRQRHVALDGHEVLRTTGLSDKSRDRPLHREGSPVLAIVDRLSVEELAAVKVMAKLAHDCRIRVRTLEHFRALPHKLIRRVAGDLTNSDLTNRPGLA